MENKYKIIQLVDSLNIGGTERMSVNIYNALTSNNVENILIVSRKVGPNYNFCKKKDNVIFLNKRSFLDIIAFLKLFKFIINYKPSVIHAHQTSIYWTFIIKLLLPRITIIWHDHWGFSDLLKDSDRRIIKYFSYLIDGVICVNEKIKDWDMRNLKLNKNFITYIPNFPFLKIIKKKENSIPILVCLANFRSQKDHLNLINACVFLRNENINFKLFLAGSIEDKEYLEKINNQINNLYLNEKIIILGPVVEISDLLSKADIGILSSVSEGLPVALLEYGLAGLPVICTDVGQCKDVLGNGEFGWVVPSKNPEKMALAIKEVLLDMQLASLKGDKLKNNIFENYGSKGFLLKYFQLIKNIKKIC